MFQYNLSSFLFSVSLEDLKKGLWIMLFGLIGVFSVIILLYLFTKFMGNISGKK